MSMTTEYQPQQVFTNSGGVLLTGVFTQTLSHFLLCFCGRISHAYPVTLSDFLGSLRAAIC